MKTADHGVSWIFWFLFFNENETIFQNPWCFPLLPTQKDATKSGANLKSHTNPAQIWRQFSANLAPARTPTFEANIEAETEAKTEA